MREVYQSSRSASVSSCSSAIASWTSRTSSIASPLSSSCSIQMFSLMFMRVLYQARGEVAARAEEASTPKNGGHVRGDVELVALMATGVDCAVHAPIIPHHTPHTSTIPSFVVALTPCDHWAYSASRRPPLRHPISRSTTHLHHSASSHHLGYGYALCVSPSHALPACL